MSEFKSECNAVHPFITAFSGVNLDRSPDAPLVWDVAPKPVSATAARPSEKKTIGEYTIGDLHGNAKLGIWHTLQAGIVKFPQGPQTYQRLSELYEEEDDDVFIQDDDPDEGEQPKDSKSLAESRKARHAEFKQIVQTLQPTEVGPFIKFRPLGDTISDRGAYDPFTLWLFDHLENLGFNLVVLASNHDMYMLCAYELAKRRLQKHGGTFTAAMVHCYEEAMRKNHNTKTHWASGCQFVTALKQGLITERDFQDLLERHKKRLRLIDYHYVPAIHPQPAGLCLYTHGVVGVEAIRSAAKYFEVEYRAATAAELMQTIDTINAAFRKMDEQRVKLITRYAFDLVFVKQQERELRKRKPDFSLTLAERQTVLGTFASKNPLIYICEARGKRSLALTKGSPQTDPETLTFGEIALSKPVDGDVSDAQAVAPSDVSETPKTPALALLCPTCNLGIIERPTIHGCEVIFVHGHHQRMENNQKGRFRYYETIPDQRFYSLDQVFGNRAWAEHYEPKEHQTVFVQLDFLSTRKNLLQTLREKREPISALAQNFSSKKRLCYAGSFLFFLPAIVFPMRVVLPYRLSLPNWILYISNLVTMGSAARSRLALSFLCACYLYYRGRAFGGKQAEQEKTLAMIDEGIAQLTL